MVNIKYAAEAAAKTYASLICLGGNYSYPLDKLADQVGDFFLPNYTSYALGEVSLAPKPSIMRDGFITQYKDWRAKDGPGTHVEIVDTRVEAVSDRTAMVWLTYHIDPQESCEVREPWEWTNVYGFSLVKDGMKNGLAGGWQWAVGDQEHEQYNKRFSPK